MKPTHYFSNDAYFNSIKPTSRNNYLTNTQRGGGLGSTLGYIGRYSLPVLQNRVVPQVKTAIIGSLKDVMDGKNVQSVIKDRTKALVADVGKDIYQAISQKGQGVSRVKRSAINTIHSVTPLAPEKKQRKRKSSSKPSKSKKPKILSKSNIFS